MNGVCECGDSVRDWYTIKCMEGTGIVCFNCLPIDIQSVLKKFFVYISRYSARYIQWI